MRSTNLVIFFIYYSCRCLAGHKGEFPDIHLFLFFRWPSSLHSAHRPNFCPPTLPTCPLRPQISNGRPKHVSKFKPVSDTTSAHDGRFTALPCSHSTSSLDLSEQGIGYCWPCAILWWLVNFSRVHATLLPALFVCMSVGWSVGLSVTLSFFVVFCHFKSF